MKNKIIAVAGAGLIIVAIFFSSNKGLFKGSITSLPKPKNPESQECINLRERCYNGAGDQASCQKYLNKCLGVELSQTTASSATANPNTNTNPGTSGTPGTSTVTVVSPTLEKAPDSYAGSIKQGHDSIKWLLHGGSSGLTVSRVCLDFNADNRDAIRNYNMLFPTRDFPLNSFVLETKDNSLVTPGSRINGDVVINYYQLQPTPGFYARQDFYDGNCTEAGDYVPLNHAVTIPANQTFVFGLTLEPSRLTYPGLSLKPALGIDGATPMPVAVDTLTIDNPGRIFIEPTPDALSTHLQGGVINTPGLTKVFNFSVLGAQESFFIKSVEFQIASGLETISEVKLSPDWESTTRGNVPSTASTPAWATSIPSSNGKLLFPSLNMRIEGQYSTGISLFANIRSPIQTETKLQIQLTGMTVVGEVSGQTYTIYNGIGLRSPSWLIPVTPTNNKKSSQPGSTSGFQLPPQMRR